MTILGKLEQEYLLRTIESGMALADRRQLFLWAQGPLQALLPHEILLCIRLSEGGVTEQVECLHRSVLDGAALAQLKDVVAPALARRWQQDGQGAPLVVDGALVHGSGAATVFALLGMPDHPDARHAYFLQLLLPYLHLALLHLPAQNGARQGPARALSTRELAVLDAVRAGRSNDEVARQLGISALTVKNHLQRVYRVLGVANRAHAVARCMTLRLL